METMPCIIFNVIIIMGHNFVNKSATFTLPKYHKLEHEEIHQLLVMLPQKALKSTHEIYSQVVQLQPLDLKPPQDPYSCDNPS